MGAHAAPVLPAVSRILHCNAARRSVVLNTDVLKHATKTKRLMEQKGGDECHDFVSQTERTFLANSDIK